MEDMNLCGVLCAIYEKLEEAQTSRKKFRIQESCLVHTLIRKLDHENVSPQPYTYNTWKYSNQACTTISHQIYVLMPLPIVCVLTWSREPLLSSPQRFCFFDLEEEN